MTQPVTIGALHRHQAHAVEVVRPRMPRQMLQKTNGHSLSLCLRTDNHIVQVKAFLGFGLAINLVKAGGLVGEPRMSQTIADHPFSLAGDQAGLGAKLHLRSQNDFTFGV